METQDNGAATPSFCMLELSVHSKDIVYVFSYNGTRFFVTISAEDLEGKGELLHQFNNFRRIWMTPTICFSSRSGF